MEQKRDDVGIVPYTINSTIGQINENIEIRKLRFLYFHIPIGTILSRANGNTKKI